MEKTKSKSFKCYLTLANIALFASSAHLQIIGFVYLFKMNYQFTLVSVNLLSGAAILVGFFTASLCILNNLSLKRSNLKLSLYILYTIEFLYLALFFLSVCALRLNADKNRVRENMNEMMREYDEKASDKYETRVFNWLHEKYSCCGVESHEDWKFLLLTNNNSRSLNYVKYVKLNVNESVYFDDVPDSCCVRKRPHCGKQLISLETSQIYMNGCAKSFTGEHRAGVDFVAKICLAFSVICLFFMFVLICKTYDSSKEPYRGLKQTETE